MADNVPASQPLEASAASGRAPWRRALFSITVIAAIAAAIWWLEYRPDSEDRSATGERFGPAALPAALNPAGAEVAPKEGALAPNFLLETLDGGELRLSDLRGSAVVLNFWATWCSPCRREIPQFVEAYDRYREEGFVIVGVNLQESPSIIERFARDFDMQFPIAIDRDGEVSDEYRLLGLPTTYFIDRQGVVRAVFRGPFLQRLQGTRVQGAISQGQLAERIEEILR